MQGSINLSECSINMINESFGLFPLFYTVNQDQRGLEFTCPKLKMYFFRTAGPALYEPSWKVKPNDS